ncbi:MAG: Efflux transporter, family, subunit [Verrucomicrobiales bacterium]|nr:Efflux transporter, family, subunit [Verrucomicrobiales bacterium]
MQSSTNPQPIPLPLEKPASAPNRPRKRKPWLGRVAIVVLALLVIGGLIAWLKPGHGKASETASATVRRGSLDITVLEGGSVQALESQEIKCEVRVGYQGTKILKLIEEGYQVSEEDVRTNKVLVELDSTELEKQMVQQEISYQSAAAALTDAQQGYDIQLNQNISDMQAAAQKARFARMDFEKFLGDDVADKIIDGMGLDKAIAAQDKKSKQLTAIAASMPSADVRETNGLVAVDLTTKPLAATISQITSNASSLPTLAVVDFSKYATLEALGDGEAKQKLRKFADDLQVAQKEYGQAKSTLEGTKRLFAKGFVTRIDTERDEIAHENARLKVQTAETARDLFLKYDFEKSAEEFMSKYSEAVREVDRARKAAISKLAQSEAKLKSAQGQYSVQSRQHQDLIDQSEKFIIRAKKPGLVVYGSGREQMYYGGGEEQIREGATVRERQSIITIPDMSKMGVNVRIHESYIKKIKKGQKVKITLDAFPDQVLDGEVTKVGVLPDSQNMWMNPDMKVYLTTISIPKSFEWLKPGMSAKVDIMVDRLMDVIYAPIQAVTPGEGKQLCYVVNGGKQDKREVQVGQFNDSFIEIKSGLHEGDVVLLHPPETAEPGANDKKPADGKPAASPAKVSAPKSGKA